MRCVLLVALLAALSGCFSSLAEHQAYVKEHVTGHAGIEAGNLSLDSFNLHYRSIGQAERAVVVWIHGTPGRWTDIGRLMLDRTFNQQIRLVAIDRPGWGASTYAEPRTVATFEEQSRLISPLIRLLKAQHPDTPLILAGHSWGASLVPGLALDNPDDVDAVLAVAGPYHAALAQPRWYSRIGSLPGINQLIGANLRRANEEMYSLPHQLKQAAQRWPKLKQPMIVLYGDNDALVDTAHITFARGIFPPRTTRYVLQPGQGHFFQFDQVGLLRDCLLAMAAARYHMCRPVSR